MKGLRSTSPFNLTAICKTNYKVDSWKHWSRVSCISNERLGFSPVKLISAALHFRKLQSLFITKFRHFNCLKGQGFKSNYIDIQSEEDCWILGPKKDDNERLYSESVPVYIDENAREEHWSLIRSFID